MATQHRLANAIAAYAVPPPPASAKCACLRDPHDFVDMSTLVTYVNGKLVCQKCQCPLPDTDDIDATPLMNKHINTGCGGKGRADNILWQCDNPKCIQQWIRVTGDRKILRGLHSTLSKVAEGHPVPYWGTTPLHVKLRKGQKQPVTLNKKYCKSTGKCETASKGHTKCQCIIDKKRGEKACSLKTLCVAASSVAASSVTK